MTAPDATILAAAEPHEPVAASPEAETEAEAPAAPKPLLEVPDLSPEARRKRALRGVQDEARRRFGPGSRFLQIAKRVFTGLWNDGFIHAGNLAYMAILSLFPFFIVGAALFSLVGEVDERAAAINAFLLAVPPVVANALEPVARSVVDARTGPLLWIGGLFGLWTVGSLIETIRDVLRRAYGTRWTHAFWRYRLLSTATIIGAIVLLMMSLAAQVLIGAAQQVIEAWIPRLGDVVSQLALSRFIPALGLYLSIYVLFYTLTPSAYRKRAYPKWPGALLVTGWWMAVTVALPPLLASVFSYDATYGSLAGIMIALFFFWLVGLGMVVGAELNAALAETPEEGNVIGQADDRRRAAQTNDGEATA